LRIPLELAQIQRQEIAVVLQKHNGFLRGLGRQLLTFRAVGDALRVVGIDVGILEETA
jgi:hypothetical protein